MAAPRELVLQELANYKLLLAGYESAEKQVTGDAAKDMLALECQVEREVARHLQRISRNVDICC